jgi:hypothetical protein
MDRPKALVSPPLNYKVLLSPETDCMDMHGYIDLCKEVHGHACIAKRPCSASILLHHTSKDQLPCWNFSNHTSDQSQVLCPWLSYPAGQTMLFLEFRGWGWATACCSGANGVPFCAAVAAAFVDVTAAATSAAGGGGGGGAPSALAPCQGQPLAVGLLLLCSPSGPCACGRAGSAITKRQQLLTRHAANT